MLDFFGKELQVGDEVAFMLPGYRSFQMGTVVKLTPQKVKVSYRNNETYTHFPEAFIRKD